MGKLEKVAVKESRKEPYKIDANSRHEGFGEGVLDELGHERALAYAAVSHDDDLKEVLTKEIEDQN